jgi:hypothetical protein
MVTGHGHAHLDHQAADIGRVDVAMHDTPSAMR